MLRDRSGHTYPSPSRPAVEPVPGDDVYLTLDAELEEIAGVPSPDWVARAERQGVPFKFMAYTKVAFPLMLMSILLAQGYLYFRFWDALAQNYTYEPGRTEGLHLLTGGPLSFNFWIIEMLLGTVVPMVMLLTPYTRRHPFWRMVALGLVALGVIAYRWDINLSGLLVVVPYLPGQSTVAYTSYRPSLVEIVTASGVIAYGLLAFSLGVKYLRVVDHRYAEEELEPVKIESTESVPA